MLWSIIGLTLCLIILYLTVGSDDESGGKQFMHRLFHCCQWRQSTDTASGEPQQPANAPCTPKEQVKEEDSMRDAFLEEKLQNCTMKVTAPSFQMTSMSRRNTPSLSEETASSSSSSDDEADKVDSDSDDEADKVDSDVDIEKGVTMTMSPKEGGDIPTNGCLGRETTSTVPSRRTMLVAENHVNNQEHKMPGKECCSSVGTTADDSDDESSHDCAICLSNFDVGDAVSWASNPACPHVFHYSCIKHWLMSSGRKHVAAQRRANASAMVAATDFPTLCPCCRRSFFQQTEASAPPAESSV